MAHGNSWSDPNITDDPRIPHDDSAVRAAAEAIHGGESLHRHDPRGVVCVYCALNAARAIAAARIAGAVAS
jgi:acyl-CoA reductase-like NAD-dependent aldehyde dehydrogenase